MTCYEHLRQHNEDKGKEFYRLKNYLEAMENDKEKEYHQKRGR